MDDVIRFEKLDNYFHVRENRTTSSTGGEKGVKLERYDLVPVRPLEELARRDGIGAQPRQKALRCRCKAA